MTDPFVLAWTVLIAASIFWYGFLVIYLGKKAGAEIVEMLRTIGGRHEKASSNEPPEEPRGR